MITVLFLTLLILFLTFLSGVCSASEAAFFSLANTKLKTFANSNNAKQKLVANLLKHPRDLLVTVFLLNTIINILLQNVVSHAFMNKWGWLASVGLPFILLLIFGEIIPKYIGIQNNEKFSLLTAPSIAFCHQWLIAIRKLIIFILTPIARIFSLFLKKDPKISRDELQYVLEESEEAGILNNEEKDLIWGSLNLQENTIREIMQPRHDILYYDINEPLTKLIHLFVDEQCSRIPVVEKELEHVIGIIDAKQYFIHRDKIIDQKDLKKILVKPIFVPENTSARTLLKKLDECGQELALAVDEYGSISGLIAYEDVVEIVVGQIKDQRDKKALFTRSGKNEIIASGKMELSELNTLFSSHLESETMVTIGGWLTEQLGDLPKSGVKYKTEEFLFQVLSADPNRIRRVYIRHLKNGGKS